MNRIFDYIRNNKAGVSIMVAVFAIIIGMGIASGCSIDSMIKVSVPPKVQEATNSPALVPLSRAPFVRKQYVNEVKLSLEEFDGNIREKSAFRDLAVSLMNTGAVAGRGALAGFPGGAMLMSVLAGVGGLYLKKPGTDTEINAAKQDSFNSGQRKAKDLLTHLAMKAVTEATNASTTDTRKG